MIVWILVSTFPAVTTTFLVNRIHGLTARGVDVHILAGHPGSDGMEVLGDDQRTLLPRTTWMSPRRGSSSRLRAAWAGLPRLARLHPMAAMGVWDPLRFRSLAGGELATAAVATLGLPRPDAVLACFGPMGELACSLRSVGMFSAPVVTSFHGVDAYGKAPNRLRARYRCLRKRGDLFLPVSRHMAATLKHIGFAADRIEVVHTPIRCDRFTWRRPRRRDPGQAARILGLGRLVAKKGFDDALRAIALLVQDGVPVRFDILGDGVERARLEALSTQLGITNQVHFAGWSSHAAVREALEQADILLSSNRLAANGDQEGIPNTIKEALAIGVPVVATRHSGTPELVTDGRSGLLTAEGDVSGLATACRRMLNNHAFAEACAIAGRRHVVDQFDEQRLDDRLLVLLETASAHWQRKKRSCAG